MKLAEKFWIGNSGVVRLYLDLKNPIVLDGITYYRLHDIVPQRKDLMERKEAYIKYRENN